MKSSLKMKKIILLVIITSLLAACSSPDYTVEIRTLDSLQNALLNTEQSLLKLDTTKAFNATQKVGFNLKYIQMHYKDTLPRSFAIFLNDYRSLKKPMAAFRSEYHNKLNQLTFDQDQIKALKEDFKNGLYDKEEAKKYFDTETASARQTINSVEIMLKAMDRVLPRFDELNPRVDSVISALRKENETF